MKRMNRARKNVALSIVTLGTVLATGTTAFAAEPVASVDVSDGSSEPTATNVDNAGVVDALVGLATTTCLLYTSPSPRDLSTSRMPSSA